MIFLNIMQSIKIKKNKMNETEYLERELYMYGYKMGKIWGEELAVMFANVPIPDKPVTVKIPLEQLANFQEFSAPTSLLMKLGSANTAIGAIGSNSVIAGSAVIT